MCGYLGEEQPGTNKRPPTTYCQLLGHVLLISMGNLPFPENIWRSVWGVGEKYEQKSSVVEGMRREEGGKFAARI